MSIKETAQTDTGFTDGSPVDVVNKLNNLHFFNIDDKPNFSSQGGLVARLDGCTAKIPGRDKNGTISGSELLNGWSVPDPASTEETPLPDIVVFAGATTAQKTALKTVFKLYEQLFQLKHNELKDLAHDESDVFQ
jgi:hypothetical protein